MITSRPTSHPPNKSVEPRPLSIGRVTAVVALMGSAAQSISGLGDAQEARSRPAHPGSNARLVFEALADLVDVLFGHELSPRVEVGGGNIAVKLQIELHHGIEALQERLLAERSHQGAALDLLKLLGAKIETIGADLAVQLELRNGVADRRRHAAVRTEQANHVLAALDQLDDRAGGDVGSDVDADICSGPRRP